MIWDTQTHEEQATLHGHEGRIKDVAFSPDGEKLFSIDARGEILIWDAASGR